MGQTGRLAWNTSTTGVAGKLLLAGLAMGLLSVDAGCTYTADFHRSFKVNQGVLHQIQRTRRKRLPKQVGVQRGFPRRVYVILGTLHSPVVEWTKHYTHADLVAAMQVKAAAVGGDAVINYRSRHRPHTKFIQGRTYSHEDKYYRYYRKTHIPVPFKGLHAWGEVILYVTPAQKARLLQLGPPPTR